MSARGDDVFAAFDAGPAARRGGAGDPARVPRDQVAPRRRRAPADRAASRSPGSSPRPATSGISVHAAARICFAAHGGQIILSAAVRSAVADSLEDGIALTSLGDWRFRGLPEPIPMFQVEAPGLPSDFPPLRSARAGRLAAERQPAQVR